LVITFFENRTSPVFVSKKVIAISVSGSSPEIVSIPFSIEPTYSYVVISVLFSLCITRRVVSFSPALIENVISISRELVLVTSNEVTLVGSAIISSSF